MFLRGLGMREIVRDYLDLKIARRGFIKRMSQAGFGAAAAASALKSLEPLVHAQAPSAGAAAAAPGPGLVTPFEGNGGELLAEQLRAAGVKFLFLGNGSGV